MGEGRQSFFFYACIKEDIDEVNDHKESKLPELDLKFLLKENRDVYNV